MTDETGCRARLADPSPWVRMEAALELLSLGCVDGHDELFRCLAHADAAVRARAAFLLGEVGSVRAIEPLRHLLDDPESSVRNEVIFALQKTQRVVVVPYLIEALRDPDLARREDARVALIFLVGPAISDALAEYEEAIPDEPEQAAVLWQALAWRFQTGICYDQGRPMSLARWIDQLATCPPEVVDVMVDQLQTWTGAEVQGTSQSELAEAWQRWWSVNVERFRPGVRYFRGHAVDDVLQ